MNKAISISVLAMAAAIASAPASAQVLQGLSLGQISSNTLVAGEPDVGEVTESDPVINDLGPPTYPTGTTEELVTETRDVTTTFEDEGGYLQSFGGQTASGGYYAEATVAGTESQEVQTIDDPTDEFDGVYESGFESNGDETASGVVLEAGISTPITGMGAIEITSTSNDDNTAALTGTAGLVTTDGLVYAKATGTATFDPETGKTTATLDAINGVELTADGLLVYSADGEGEEAVAISSTGINLNGGTITNLADGVANSDAATVGQMKAADTTLTGRIAAEEAARATAVTNEAAARTAADTALGTRITNETADRIAADKKQANASNSAAATAIAMGGLGIIPDVNYTLAANVGFYAGAKSIAVQGAAKVSPNVYVTGAVGGGLNKGGKLGGRVGVLFGF